MLRCSSIVMLCLASANALAEGEPSATGPSAPMPAPAATVGAPAPMPLETNDAGLGLRNGFSLSVGQEFGSGPTAGFSGQLFGADWRIGARITEQISIYGDTHLSFGNAKLNGVSGVTGNFAAAVIGEYELPKRVFVGGGGGYGVLNNPSGPLAQLRAGWYPLEHTGQGKARRLNIALDARWYFPGEVYGTITQLSLTLGYDRF